MQVSLSAVSMASMVLVLVAWALGAGLGCGTVTRPFASSVIKGGSVYVQVEVLENQVFEVWIREGLQDPAIDITAAFTFSYDAADNFERQHANIEVPLGTHEVWVVQYHATYPTLSWVSDKTQFTRAAGLATELGALTGTNGTTFGQVISQAIGGAVERPAPDSDLALVFGLTDLNGATVLPSSIAFSTDADPSDGLTTTYFDEGGSGSIEAALGPLVAGEDEIELGAAFADGSDIYAYYWRFHTSGALELGLAKMAGGSPPFVRETFTNTSALFGDNYSLFEDGELQPGSGAVVFGADLYLYGLHLPAGATTNEVFAARVPLNALTLADSYEYWTGSVWDSAATVPLSLWTNSGPPSVVYNTQEASWVAVSSVEQNFVAPYFLIDTHSTLAVRMAPNLEGPWTTPIVVWGRPQTVVGGPGSSYNPVILPGLENGSTITIAANDGGEWTEPTNAYLYEVDLSQLVFTPTLDPPPDPTFQNPYPVTGVAAPGDLVRIYVDDVPQASATVLSDGSFVVPIVLADGPNSVYAVAESGALSSEPTAVQTFNYQNAAPRSVTGPIATDTVWTPGEAPGLTGPYLISANFTIDPGATLTILAGVEIQVDGGYAIDVDGGLVVEGSAVAPVTFTSTTATRGAWSGIDLNANSGPIEIDHALIEFADRAIEVANAVDLTLTNSTIREFANYGVKLGITSFSGTTGQILDCVFDNSSGVRQGTAIQISHSAESSVLIQGNLVRGATAGIFSHWASPQIIDNLLELNDFGLRVRYGFTSLISMNEIRLNVTGIYMEGATNPSLGDPQPTFSFNRIHSNSNRNLRFGQTWGDRANNIIVAENNYWGTIDPEQVAISIEDRSDASKSPTVDFLPILDIDGAWVPLPNNLLNGRIDSNSTLTVGETYDVVGTLAVAPAVTLTIPDGVVMRFGSSAALIADGTLLVTGLSTSLPLFTSAAAVPARGDWTGIIIGQGSAVGVIDWAEIEFADTAVQVEDPASLTIRNSEMREFSSNGVRVESDVNQTGVTLTVEDSVVDNSAGARQGDGLSLGLYGSPTVAARNNTVRGTETGIFTFGASPLIDANTLTENTDGMYIRYGNSTSTPVVTNNIITGNDGYGISVNGSCCTAPHPNPNPAINLNELHSNGSYDLYLNTGWPNDPDPGTLVIDAQRNYWGTTDPALITSEIFDFSDHSRRPVVDFAPFLDVDGNEVGSGTLLIGNIDTPTTLTSQASYDIAGTLVVDAGVTLTVPDGVTLNFVPGAKLLVNGTLLIQGTTPSPVRLKSALGSPSRGDWASVTIAASSTGTIIDGAIIEHAQTGIKLDAGGSATILNTEIREFSDHGLWSDAAAALTADGLTIDNTGGALQGNGIYLKNASSAVEIQNSLIQGASNGVYLYQSDARIVNCDVLANGDGFEIIKLSTPELDTNRIENNSQRGILLLGTPQPQPLMHDNTLQNNATFNLESRYSAAPDSTVLNAEGNYWGSVDPTVIAASISDRTDIDTRPTVDFVPFNDEFGATVPAPDLILGPLDDSTPLSVGTSYQVVGRLIAIPGATLTLPAGSSYAMDPATSVVAAGTLIVAGTSGSPVAFTSASVAPAAGDWDGLEIRDATGLSTVDYASIQHATTAILIDGVDAAVRDSTIGVFSTNGIRLVNGAGGTIADNLIDNTSQIGTGVSIEASSPTLTGNTVQNTETGIEIIGAASPTVGPDNTVTANAVGILLQGTGASGGNPSPTINQNQIFGNVAASIETNLRTENFYLPELALIDLRQNYWGSTVLATILLTLDAADHDVPFDLSLFTDVNGVIVGSNGLFTELFAAISHTPTTIAPSLGDVSAVSFELVAPASVTVTIYEETDDALAAPVWSSALGTLATGVHTELWDGTYTAGGLVPDEAYVYVIVADDGSLVSTYDPARPAAAEAFQQQVGSDLVLAPYRNDFTSWTYRLTGRPARVTATVSIAGAGSFNVWDLMPVEPGDRPFIFDGRDTNGLVQPGQVTYALPATQPLKPNTIIVERTAPTITGTGVSPNLEVKADPYLAYHSYGQHSRIVYRLDQDAVVTVKLLRPGTADPSVPANVVATLTDAENQLAATDYEVHWWGWATDDPSDPNDPNADQIAIVTEEEGPFTFTIEAENPLEPTRKTLYRGALQLRR